METKNKVTVKRERYTATELRIREAEGKESRTITGYAILFNTPSAPFYEDDEEEVREVIAPSAVSKELLDTCDIKMTMFHDRQLILARSNNGTGTLSYSVDDKGVAFEFEAPNTVDGDKALELVRRGDIAGCSFMFATHYYDRGYVSRTVERKDGKTNITLTVNTITGIYDFTLAADPAYPDTTCEAGQREIVDDLHRDKTEKAEPRAEENKNLRKQVREMRRAAAQKILNV